jgi:hypothetical protein
LIAVLVLLFQGVVALPLAFALERALGFPPMAADNPKQCNKNGLASHAKPARLLILVEWLQLTKLAT